MVVSAYDCVKNNNFLFLHVGNTALHLAAKHGHLEAVKFMVENGAPVCPITKFFNKIFLKLFSFVNTYESV